MSIKEEKAALRREIKQRIRALSKEDIKSQSISACKLGRTDRIQKCTDNTQLQGAAGGVRPR